MSTQRTAVKLLLAAVIVEGIVAGMAIHHASNLPAVNYPAKEIRTYFPMPAEIRYFPAKPAHHLKHKSIHCNTSDYIHPIVLP
jgi:hypothetical protein